MWYTEHLWNSTRVNVQTLFRVKTLIILCSNSVYVNSNLILYKAKTLDTEHLRNSICVKDPAIFRSIGVFLCV